MFPAMARKNPVFMRGLLTRDVCFSQTFPIPGQGVTVPGLLGARAVPCSVSSLAMGVGQSPGRKKSNRKLHSSVYAIDRLVVQSMGGRVRRSSRAARDSENDTPQIVETPSGSAGRGFACDAAGTLS